MKKQLPLLTPPCTVGETDARRRFNVTIQHVLPLWKGELEEGEPSVVLCGWNSKSKIINLKSIGSVI